MADYLSSYEGQEIDDILSKVAGKVNVVDIVDNETVGDSVTPSSSRLMKSAHSKITTINETLNNKVMKIDTGEQTVNGKKTFSALLTLNGGGIVPAGNKITLASKATDETDAVNLAVLKEHALSGDSAGSGINISSLSTGYLKLDVDFSTIAVSDSTAPSYLMVATGGKSYAYSYENFLERIYESEGFVSKVNKTTYDNKMSLLDTAINNRVLISSYNVDLSATNVAINNRVLTTTYTSKMTQLDNLIATKVDQTAYNTAITSINSGKLDKVIYDGTTAYSNGNSSVPINGTVVVATLPQPALGMKLLVSCSFNSASVVDLFEIWVCGSKGKVSSVFQNSTSTITFTFTANGTNVNITATHNNVSYAMAVSYKILANLA